jgi:hypothetical protein
MAPPALDRFLDVADDGHDDLGLLDPLLVDPTPFDLPPDAADVGLSDVA